MKFKFLLIGAAVSVGFGLKGMDADHQQTHQSPLKESSSVDNSGIPKFVQELGISDDAKRNFYTDKESGLRAQILLPDSSKATPLDFSRYFVSMGNSRDRQPRARAVANYPHANLTDEERRKVQEESSNQNSTTNVLLQGQTATDQSKVSGSSLPRAQAQVVILSDAEHRKLAREREFLEKNMEFFYRYSDLWSELSNLQEKSPKTPRDEILLKQLNAEIATMNGQLNAVRLGAKKQ